MIEDMVWEIVERGSGPIQEEIYVGIRRSGIKFSAAFEILAQIREKNYKFAQIKRNTDERCLLIELLTEGTYLDMKKTGAYLGGIYSLLADGGSVDKNNVQKGGSLLGCGTIVQSTPWLYQIAKEKQVTAKRFKPERTNKKNVWLVRFVHVFENEAPVGFIDIDASVKGIYRFLDKERNVLYVGQGLIARRRSVGIYSKAMDAAFFQWTIIPDKAMRLKAEAFHLDRYKDQHGRLPLWNKVANLQGSELNKSADEIFDIVGAKVFEEINSQERTN